MGAARRREPDRCLILGYCVHPIALRSHPHPFRSDHFAACACRWGRLASSPRRIPLQLTLCPLPRQKATFPIRREPMILDLRTISHGAIHGNSVRRVISLGLLSLFGVSGLAAAATLCVNPGGHLGCRSTFSAAVTAASAGDTILVAPGTYKEAVAIT